MEKPDADSLGHYETVAEVVGLLRSSGQLELARTQELLARFLPPPPAAVLDVGGGPGIYACWLAQRGYQVHLIDIVAGHVEQALRASQEMPDGQLAGAEVGDARKLKRSDASGC